MKPTEEEIRAEAMMVYPSDFYEPEVIAFIKGAKWALSQDYKSIIPPEIDKIMQKGHDAMLDEIIGSNLKILTRQPFTSSVQHFCESGKCSGSFRTALIKMLDEYGKICEVSQDSTIKKIKHIDEHYKDWCGESHTTNSCHPVHDSAECTDFAEYFAKQLQDSTIEKVKELRKEYQNDLDKMIKLDLNPTGQWYSKRFIEQLNAIIKAK